MHIYDKSTRDLVIVRVTPSGRMSFYTGKGRSYIRSECWSVERDKARVFHKTHAEVVEHVPHLPVGEKDFVMVLPPSMIDHIVRWERDTRSRQRREHRALRKP